MSHHKITVPLTRAGIKSLVDSMKDYQRWIEKKATELAERLTQYGVGYAQIEFSGAIYDGERENIDVSVRRRHGKNRYAIVAKGKELLFIEFGTGVKYGYGHPQAAEHGMGPGTWPKGVGHWNDPNGWNIPADKGGGHTYGNPPNMSMYRTAKELHDALERIATDVFSGG